MGTKKVLLLLVVLVVTADAQSSIGDQTGSATVGGSAGGAGVGLGVAARDGDDDRVEPDVFHAIGDGLDNFFVGTSVGVGVANTGAQAAVGGSANDAGVGVGVPATAAQSIGVADTDGGR
jgi:hypothetical protein